MNDFIQVEEYLTRKIKENCDEFDKFLMIEIAGVDGSTELSDTCIETLYQAARVKVENGFDTDFDNLSNWYEHLKSGILFSIYNRGKEKIQTFTDYKLSLVLNKYQMYQKYQMKCNKYTLLDWLSGKDEF